MVSTTPIPEYGTDLLTQIMKKFQHLRIQRPKYTLCEDYRCRLEQSYEIKSPPWTILWFRILGIFSVEYIKRLCVFMFQTCSNSQLLRRVLWINAELTIAWILKHKNTQPSYISNWENPQNSEPQNRPRRGLDIIALVWGDHATMQQEL